VDSGVGVDVGGRAATVSATRVAASSSADNSDPQPVARMAKRVMSATRLYMVFSLQDYESSCFRYAKYFRYDTSDLT